MKKAGLVLFTEPFLFPPTLHAAAILAGNGWEVDILGMRIPKLPQWAMPQGVKVCYLGRVRRGLLLRWDYTIFNLRCRTWARRARPRAVIGYDQMAAVPAFVAARAAGACLVYHNHDLTLPSHVRGVFYRMTKWGEHYTGRRADLVVFPQEERAELFRKAARLLSAPRIVQNAPRADWAQLPQEAPPDFVEWKASVGKVVLYQGGLAEHRGLYPLLDSLPEWRFRGGLCLVGLPLEPGIVATLRQRAQLLKVADRVLILGPVPHDQLAGLTTRADVGVGVLAVGAERGLDEKLVNLKFLAGASNKVFEYMAAGLPVLSARGGGFEKFLTENENGVFCDGADLSDIARTLNRLFANPELCGRISRANRAAFARKYSYEKQFAPVLELLEKWQWL